MEKRTKGMSLVSIQKHGQKVVHSPKSINQERVQKFRAGGGLKTGVCGWEAQQLIKESGTRCDCVKQVTEAGKSWGPEGSEEGGKNKQKHQITINRVLLIAIFCV